MKSVLGDLINEEGDKCQHSSKVETKIEVGFRKKTNAERQREYRQRLKAKKAQNKKVKHRKTNAEMCKQYRDRLREEKLITKYYSNILSTNKKIKLNDNNEDNSIWKKIYTVSNHSNEEQIQQHVPSQENNKINLSLQGIYEEFYECVTPNVILCHETDIPADGNCLFHSLIRILQLSISTTELRKQLLDSPYLYSCNDPHNASKILRSDFEYGDLDCIFIFSRVYNINICVHYHFLNKAKKEDARYSYFKVNDTGNVIHLHLTGNHFTPYVESLHISQENKSSSLNDDNITFQADDRMQDPCDNNFIANRIKAEKYNHENEMPFESEERDVEIKVVKDCKDMKFKDDATIPIYSNYSKHSQSHYFFLNDFKDNTFGHSCPICDRLWCKKDLKKTSKNRENILQQLFPNYTSDESMEVCSTCKAALDKNKIPLLSTYNGFSYPQIPSNLPKLNFIEQRLISPRIPFIQIRRLRHINGQDSIYGQIINIPIEINTMVKKLPRNFEDDHSFYVHLRKRIIHKSSYIDGVINKSNIKQWLSYLVNMPLYVHHDIKMDNSFFKSNVNGSQLTMDDVSEHVPPDDKRIEQQQTLMWNEDNFFHIAPGENKASLSLLFDTYAEELSFPTIYGGQFRTYREGIIVTPFMQATSELLRTDRRAADPQHLLYIAAKIMRLRFQKNDKGTTTIKKRILI